MLQPIAILTLLCGMGTGTEGEQVSVPGSDTRFPQTIKSSVGGKMVKMKATGVGMRTRYFLNIYTIASYIQAEESFTSPEEIAEKDCPKRLHLVMERTLDGKDMADAFRSSIRMNHPEPAFRDEVNKLVQFLRSSSTRRGENIYLTHVPGIGLQINVSGKADFLIKNVDFSKAMWQIYFGDKNINESLRKSLSASAN